MKPQAIPSLDLKELGPNDEAAFYQWYQSWSDDDPEWASFVWKPGMTHETHLQIHKDQKDRNKIPANRVPSTMLYGFASGEIVGRFSIRHELNEFLFQRGGHVGYAVSPLHRRKGYALEMFRLGMQYCRKLGLTKILITCDENNIGSWSIIERFDGQLENRFKDEKEDVVVRRYWVTV